LPYDGDEWEFYIFELFNNSFTKVHSRHMSFRLNCLLLTLLSPLFWLFFKYPNITWWSEKCFL